MRSSRSRAAFHEAARFARRVSFLLSPLPFPLRAVPSHTRVFLLLFFSLSRFTLSFLAALGGVHNDEAVWRACANATVQASPLLPSPLFASAAATAIAAKVRALVVGVPSAARRRLATLRYRALPLCALLLLLLRWS